MSKLADAIKRSQRTESTPMGFGSARKVSGTCACAKVAGIETSIAMISDGRAAAPDKRSRGFQSRLKDIPPSAIGAGRIFRAARVFRF